ncbi:M56 family metallopeptidase [Zunongwangia sp. F363]|uniref:M56 family metallopeptidase n=1 Tax=Autumnicola tepida TaxID=3075595 RepID=A0ABU3CE49_9FLAO|nr:M56 family metallopeptidase [Zunongwangia sp. F363]MDT0644615.1 M56 family metallopeptidase [Zunongwangia sp. F363]
MENFIIYILKSAGILSLFYLFYVLLLRTETSFEANRKFLITGIISSLTLPAIYFTKVVFIEVPQQNLRPSSQLINYAVSNTEETTTDWWQVVTIIYAVVAGLMLLKLIYRIYKAVQLVMSSTASASKGYRLIEDPGNTGAFSFFKYIFYNPELHSQEELEMILQHEKVHAAQFHSVDIILVNLISGILWFNPLAWLYKRSVEENLEFIADSKTAALSPSKTKYQQTLVKVAVPDFHPALTNHFYQSFIKKRILMLNKNINPRPKIWKMSLILPLLLGFMLLFNVETEAQIVEKKETPASKSKRPVSVIIDLNTTDDQLSNFSEKFKKENIRLDFKNIKRSSEGLLTSITTKFKDQNTGRKGELSLKKAEGISPFTFYIQPDGTIGLHPVEKKDQQITTVGPTTGQKQKKENIQITGKGRITVNTDNHSDSSKTFHASGGNKRYGHGSKGGGKITISQTTSSSTEAGFAHSQSRDSSKYSNLKVTVDGEVRESFNENDIDPESIAKISVRKNGSGKDTVKITTKSNKNNLNVIIAHSKNQQKPRPIFVVNGKVQPGKFTGKDIDPSNIDHINVLKGNSATDKYGKKGKKGVVEIYLKKNEVGKGFSTDSNYWHLSSSYSNEALENIRKTLKSKKNLDVEFSGIKRHDNGKITAITIQASAKGKNASASFSQDNGIPDVVVGLDEDENLIISSSKFYWQKN